MTRLTDEQLDAAFAEACKRWKNVVTTGEVSRVSAPFYFTIFEAGWRSAIDAIEAELSKQEPVARPRLPRIDHFAREAFEKFASGVECELTNYRWFEAGWDARGDTVAAAPLPSAPDTVQVPREPTQDMLYAMAELDGWKRGDREHPMLTRWEDYWVAALAAAPKSTP